MENFKEKYLKYKAKYLVLKEQIGGLTPEQLELIQPIATRIQEVIFGRTGILIEVQPEDGHPNVDYYQETLNILENYVIDIFNRNRQHLDEILRTYEYRPTILIIDGENKLTKQCVQNYIDDFTREYFGQYNIIINVYKSQIAGETLNRARIARTNDHILDIQVPSNIRVGVGGFISHGADDLLVVLITKYLERFYGVGAYNVSLGIHDDNMRRGREKIPPGNCPPGIGLGHSLNEPFRGFGVRWFLGRNPGVDDPPGPIAVATGDKYVFM